MKKIFLASLCLLATPFFVSAQLKKADGNSEIKKVQEANKNTSSIQCPFVRTTKVAAINSTTTSDGTFYFSAPDNLSMKYSDGENLIVTADNVSLSVGGKVRTLRAGNRHVEDLSATLLACVKGQISNIEGTLLSAKTSGKNIVFKIKTDLTVGRNKVSTLELAYDKTDLTLVSLNMLEADGSNTLYELKSKTLNKSIDSSVFEHPKQQRKRATK